MWQERKGLLLNFVVRQTVHLNQIRFLLKPQNLVCNVKKRRTNFPRTSFEDYMRVSDVQNMEHQIHHSFIRT